VSIVKLLDIDGGKSRIDSEFYKKVYLILEKQIEAIGGVKLKDIQANLDCSAFYPSVTGYYNFKKVGVPFLRVNEIQKGLVKITDSTAFLPQFVLDENPTTIAIAFPGDIIVAKGGNTLAKVGLITAEYNKYAVSRDVIIIRTNKLQDYNKYLLWSFYHSTYGQQSLLRSASQTGQPHLTLDPIYDLEVPNYNDEFAKLIEMLYVESVDVKKQADRLYKMAEKIITDELKITNEYLSEPNFTIKKISDTFAITGRLDSEHYETKYDVLEKELKNLKYTYINLEFDTFKNSCGNYDDKGTVGVIKTKQITKRYISQSIESFLTESVVIKNKLTTLEDEDVIFASMGVGSLGKVNVYYYEGKYVTDSTLRIFRKKPNGRILPEYLAMFLQATTGQELIYKYIVGSTGIINIYDEDIYKIPVPILRKKIQNEIRDLVKKSYNLEKLSAELLEISKRSIEIAIEKDENTAEDWLKQQEKKIIREKK